MSRRPLNPYAQPYHPHDQSLVSAVPNPNLVPAETSADHIEDQNPSRSVAPRRRGRRNNSRPRRNVGPRLRSPQTRLAEIPENQHSRRPTCTTSVWMKKDQASNSATTTIPTNHGSNEAAAFSDARNGFEVTTVMIRNIPCRLRQSELLLMLEKHCLNENKKAGSFPKSEFNFIYLPLDFEQFRANKLISNLGYAFVNFTTAVGARRFYKSHNHSKWDEVVNSPKICEITCAKFQGLDALEKRFRGRRYQGLTEEFMPLILDPACDGERESEQVTRGRF